VAREIIAKSILNKTRRRDPWFLDDYTINPFSACPFNCLYCYIRGSKYGIHMQEKVSVKTNAIPILEKQLNSCAKRKEYGYIVIASATDPYLQIEEKYQLTRRILELILKYRFPLHIITKSPGVLRDIDLLHEIDKKAFVPEDLQSKTKHGVFISFSISTMNDEVAKIFEPGAPAPSLRLKAIEQLLKEGFWTGVSLMPLLPYISDTGEHLQLLFQTFANINVKYVLPATLTLPGSGEADAKTLYFEAVRKNFPELLEKYHRLFGSGSEMPAYYKEALRNKTNELAKAFGLRTTILKAT